MFMYASGRFEKLVSAQTVHLVGGKHRRFDIPESDVTIRFNDDTLPATVLATPLYERPNILNVNPKLVLVTMPPVTLIHSDGSIKNVCNDHVKNWPVGVPVEIVSLSRWKRLAKQMPIWPLTGLVCLSMLRLTNAAKIVLHEFDFYKDSLESIDLHKGLYIGKMHDVLASIDWLERVLSIDSRISFANQTDLTLIKSRWRERQLLNYVSHRRVEVVGHMPTLNHLVWATSYCCNGLFGCTL